MRQTLVQLTDELVEALDRRARREGVSRSKLVRDLLDAALSIGAEHDRALIEGYGRAPQDDAADIWGDLDAWTDANTRRNRAAMRDWAGGDRRVVTRGEVWWSEDEHLGRRPVLVLSRAAVLPVLARPLVAPLTTRVRGLPTEVHLDDDDGLPGRLVSCRSTTSSRSRRR